MVSKSAAKKTKIVLEPRAALGRRACRGIRRQGQIPAVLYGLGKPTASVFAKEEEVRPAVTSGARLVDISIDGADAKALVKEVQLDALGKHILHLDLQRIAMDVAVEVTVPLQVRGTPIGAKEGGVLEVHVRELAVSCLPDKIPERVRRDVSALNVNDFILGKQIVLPEGVTLSKGQDVIVAIVKIPLEKIEEPVAEGALAEPEVLVGPKDKEGEEGEAKEGKPEKGEKAVKPEKPEKPEKKG